MDSEAEMRSRFAAALEAMAAQAAGDPRKLGALAAMAAEKGLAGRAYELALAARALAPDDPDIASLTAGPIAGGVPGWHFRIVRDERRNAAYREVLERAVTPSTRVLDIGAGTGLLSMMAARAGAAEVVACEMNRAVADAAAEIVARNGLDDKVRVVPRHSGAVDAQADLGGRVDVIVSEIVSNDLLVEQALPVMADAVPRLLKAGGKVIPARGAIRVALAHWEGLAQRRIEVIDGFDLSPFNRLARLPYQVSVGDPRLSLRSEAHDLFAFDFASGGPYAARRASVMLANTGGDVNGVAQWIWLGLDEETDYENRPAPGASSCWACLFHPLEKPVGPSPGAEVRVSGAHTLSTLRLWAEPA